MGTAQTALGPSSFRRLQIERLNRPPRFGDRDRPGRCVRRLANSVRHDGCFTRRGVFRLMAGKHFDGGLKLWPNCQLNVTPLSLVLFAVFRPNGDVATRSPTKFAWTERDLSRWRLVEDFQERLSRGGAQASAPGHLVGGGTTVGLQRLLELAVAGLAQSGGCARCAACARPAIWHECKSTSAADRLSLGSFFGGPGPVGSRPVGGSLRATEPGVGSDGGAGKPGPAALVGAGRQFCLRLCLACIGVCGGGRAASKARCACT